MNSPRSPSAPVTSDHNANDCLDSWGEIASYLRRGIRTVRRWEREEGLPVHRHLHRKAGSVYAFRPELDAWRNNRSPQLVPSEGGAPSKWTLRVWGVIAIVLLLGVVGAWVKPLSSGRQMTPHSIRALAVLPFDDLSVNPENKVFADGMTEQLITSLAKVMPLRITSRNSVMHYGHSEKSLREIAQQLNVDALVRGSVQIVGQQVIVTIRLIDARDDRHIWANSYAGEVKDILGLEERTAETAADKIRIALNPGHP